MLQGFRATRPASTKNCARKENKSSGFMYAKRFPWTVGGNSSTGFVVGTQQFNIASTLLAHTYFLTTQFSNVAKQKRHDLLLEPGTLTGCSICVNVHNKINNIPGAIELPANRGTLKTAPATVNGGSVQHECRLAKRVKDQSPPEVSNFSFVHLNNMTRATNLQILRIDSLATHSLRRANQSATVLASKPSSSFSLWESLAQKYKI